MLLSYFITIPLSMSLHNIDSFSYSTPEGSGNESGRESENESERESGNESERESGNESGRESGNESGRESGNQFLYNSAQCLSNMNSITVEPLLKNTPELRTPC